MMMPQYPNPEDVSQVAMMAVTVGDAKDRIAANRCPACGQPALHGITCGMHVCIDWWSRALGCPQRAYLEEHRKIAEGERRARFVATLPVGPVPSPGSVALVEPMERGSDWVLAALRVGAAFGVFSVVVWALLYANLGR